jgi:hypothetical protein
MANPMNKGKQQYQVTLLRMERTIHYKVVRASSVFEAFEKARAEFEEPYIEDGKGGGHSVQVDNVEPVEMKGE